MECHKVGLAQLKLQRKKDSRVGKEEKKTGYSQYRPL